MKYLVLPSMANRAIEAPILQLPQTFLKATYLTFDILLSEATHHIALVNYSNVKSV